MKAEDYLKKAYRSIYENDFEQAIESFEDALVLEPDNADIHYRCSITCARSNRFDKALSHALLASAIAPLQKEFKLHYDRLQSKELTVMAKKLLEKHDDGTAADKPGAAESAVNLLKRAVELDPLSVDSMAWLAIAYSELEQYEAAIKALKEATSLPQDDAIAKQLRELRRRISKYLT